MKRCHFDLYNGHGPVPNDGQPFESREQARAEAIRISQEVARDEMPDRDLVNIPARCAMRRAPRCSRHRFS
ncbi:DUF6894 family protein [Mesorhizobium sp. CO1-1-9]|uniref:DUF6894 family protein n=1 Tax=Mesorhizobium sp. CO1-1-9 TaxID=2876630 RepID=UPI00398C7C88